MLSPHAYTGYATDVQDLLLASSRFRNLRFPSRDRPTAPRCSVTDDRAALKQQIKEANDIVDVVGSYLQLRPLGPTFKCVCPFHDDHRPSMDVDPRRQRYRCWACGKHGDVFNFVQDYDKVTFPEALEILARRAGISLEKIQKNPQGPSRTGMFDVMQWAAEQFQKCLLDSP